MIAVFVGPPGSGKSTQAARLSLKCGLTHLEMGEVLRELAVQDTALGRDVRAYVDRGLLVPEGVVKKVIYDRLLQPEFEKGFILDGFPRNVSQAKILDKMLDSLHQKLDAVILFEVPVAVAVQRLSGRRMCRKCGASYHVQFTPPAIGSLCDRCSGALYQRTDDRPEVVKSRLEVFARETAPLIQFYEQRHLLKRVDASRSPDEVFVALTSIIPCS